MNAENQSLPSVEKRQAKTNAITALCGRLKTVSSFPLNVNSFWNNTEKNEALGLSKLWKSRAHFIQDIKRFAPDNVEVVCIQKKGTVIRRIK